MNKYDVCKESSLAIFNSFCTVVARLKFSRKKSHVTLLFGTCHNRFFFFVFLGLYSRHMEVPRLGVESELQLLAYTTAIGTPDLSCVCYLHHSSQHLWILNPLNGTRDHNLSPYRYQQGSLSLNNDGNSIELQKFLNIGIQEDMAGGPGKHM